MEKKIKLLLVTSMAWNEDNNIGNTYSNIFKGMEDKIEFAHIYCRGELPKNSICKKYYQMNENTIIKSLFNKKQKLGNKFEYDNNLNENLADIEKNSKMQDKMRVLRWEIFFLARNILWRVAKWKTDELNEFIDEFNPDIIFGTLTYMPNINRLMVYIQERIKVPMICYAWDDVYTYKQFNYSPLFWFRRFTQRKHIMKTVEHCEYMYGINNDIINEYGKIFNKKMKLLIKSYEFIDDFQQIKEIKPPIKMIYTGNIGAGRVDTLVKLANSIKLINKNEKLFFLEIYTTSPLNKQIEKSLNIEGCSSLMPPVSFKSVLVIQKKADILVHVEPTKRKDHLTNRLSLSTKIVDYFFAGKTILAIGKHTAAMNYLESMDAAIIQKNPNKTFETLTAILNNPELLNEYAEKAYNCGVKNHNKVLMQETLLKDFQDLLNKQTKEL